MTAWWKMVRILESQNIKMMILSVFYLWVPNGGV